MQAESDVEIGAEFITGAPVGYETATIASNALRLLARMLNLPIVVVCQVNRPAARAKDHLSCHDLRDSGCIENDAAAVVLVDAIRDQDGPSDRHNPIRFLQLLVGKNRYGAITPADDPIELTWYPRIARIEDGPDIGGHR